MERLEDVRNTWIKVFDEDFEAYHTGPFSEGYSAIREFHYPPRTVDQGPWEEMASHHAWSKKNNPEYPNWWIIEENGEKVLKQSCNNRLNRRNWKYFIKKLFFPSRLPLTLALPALSAGDGLWGDYCISAQVQPLSDEDLAGILFRMLDGQRHYVLALKRKRVALYKRDGNEMIPLVSRRFRYFCNQFYTLSAVVEKERIECFVNGKSVLETKDTSFPAGKIGFVVNVPTLFRRVDVYMHPESHRSVEKAFQARLEHNRLVREQYPPMELWKKMRLPSPCSGRTLRFGDLTGDGRPDIMIAQGKPLAPGDNYNAISCLTAVDLEGNALWQNGTPSDEKRCLNSDLAFQIYDIDGDGLNEVICTRNFHLEILDGRNGAIKARIPTPQSVPPHNKFHKIVGDAIYICNLSGRDRPQDILVKDRYSMIWAYDRDLRLLWEYRSQREMGHFPFTMDINNDGKEEILVGYSLLGADGKKLWELPLNDHADAVAALKISSSNDYMIVIAGSDEGLIFADIKGTIKRKLRLGHMQTVTVAKLIPDSSRFQIATNTYWGNPGIIYILDLNGNILKSFQPSTNGSPLCPVNWAGNGEELLLLSAAPDETGGLYDGCGNQTVVFPDDGHPTLCYNAFDLNGDGLDELICWDHDSLWVYTRSNNTRNRTPWMPLRFPPLYNASNYRSNISI